MMLLAGMLSFASTHTIPQMTQSGQESSAEQQKAKADRQTKPATRMEAKAQRNRYGADKQPVKAHKASELQT